MEAAWSREAFDCPFCNFSDRDHYDLLLHVENVHPETARASSAPRQEVDRGPHSELEIAEEASDYLACECGEWFLASELESHLEMHYAESMSFEEAAKSPSEPTVPRSTVYQGKASSPRRDITPPNPSKDVKSRSQKVTLPKSVTARQSRAEGRKSQSLVQDMMDVLRHSSTPSSQRPSKAVLRRGPQRLGVSLTTRQARHRLLMLA